MELKTRIRDIRKGKGLTLEHVASRIGVSIPHLSEVERGKKNLNNHLLTRISEALDTPVRDLFVHEEQGAVAELTIIAESLEEPDVERLRDFAVALAASRKADAQT